MHLITLSRLTSDNKPGILFLNNIKLCTSTYTRVCAISGNLAQNRLRLIHDVDLYMGLYGSKINILFILTFLVVIFALRHSSGATLTSFNLGLK